jgi:surface antigen
MEENTGMAHAIADLPSSPDVIVFDAITKAVETATHFHSVEWGGACMNMAGTVRRYAEILECGMWPEPPDA